MRLRILIVLAAAGAAGCGDGAEAALPAVAERVGWFTVTSSRFAALTSAEPGTVADLLRRLEALHETVEKGDLGLHRQAPVPLRIVVFADLADFAPYNKLREDGTAAAQAYFSGAPDVDYLAIALPQEAAAVRVLHHEFLHRVLSANAPGLPLWLNEGLAEYYSTFHARGATATIGDPVAGYLPGLEAWQEQGPLFDLRHLFTIDAASPEYTQQPWQGLFYAQSWALTHMLAQSGLATGRFRQLLDRLAEGQDFTASFEAIYGTGGYDSLLTALRRHIRTGAAGARSHQLAETFERRPVRTTPAGRGEVLVALGDLQRRLGSARQEAARAHYESALDVRPELAPALVGLGRLAAAQGDTARARGLYSRAMTSDSSNAEAPLWAGLQALERAKSEDADWLSVSKGTPATVRRARDLLGRSLELSPGRPVAVAAFAETYQFEWGERARGCLRRLQAATAGQAMGEDVAVAFATLAAQAGAPAEAERIIDTQIAPMRSRSATLRARRALARAELRRAHEQIASGRRSAGVSLAQRTLDASDDSGIRREALRLLGAPGGGPQPADLLGLYDEGVAALERRDWRTAQARFQQVRDGATDAKLRAEADVGLTDVRFYTGLEKVLDLVRMGRRTDARAQLDILGHLPLRSEQRQTLQEWRQQLR